MSDIRSLLNLQPGEKATFQVELLAANYSGPKVAITCVDLDSKCSVEKYYKVNKISVEVMEPEPFV